MEPIQKKAKITDHFRVALKPQNVNVQRTFKKFKLQPDFGKENQTVEVITISDEDDDNDDDDDERTIRKQSQSQQEQNDNKNDKTTKLKWIRNEKQEEEEKEEEDRDENNPQELEQDDDHKRVLDSQPIPQPNINPHHPHHHDYHKTAQHIHSLNKYKTPAGLSKNSNIVDHDKTLLNNFECEPHYAWDSFNYDREQEIRFRSRKYLDDLHHDHKITPQIRARLVDWLVQIQDIFSLYHETLYMAVKIADQYLMSKTVAKNQLQLLYMTTILISAKFDERLPPIEISDLLQQSGGVYSRKQVINFEVDILRTLNFNIRFPLSYGFLRRYARCTGSEQKTLTLARYILESSLLEYEMIEILESELAAASLLLAFKMLRQNEAWNETAIFYTKYRQEDLYLTLTKLNDIISRPIDRKISTIRNKYSNHVFMSVARIPPLAGKLLLNTAGPPRKFGLRMLNHVS